MKSLVEEWRQEYDFIVIDCPPVLPVTDTQVIENIADATVLIARTGATTRIGLQRAYKLLLPHSKAPEASTIGVLLNFIDPKSPGYYGYYGYYGTEKYGYKELDGDK
jgi:polysaccharide biosynthesis transport protein